MEPQKLFKLTPEDRASKASEACTLMTQIRALDAARVAIKARHREELEANAQDREPLQVQLLALLEDLEA